MHAQSTTQSPRPTTLTPAAVREILAADALWFTGAYIDPCGHSIAVRQRLEGERMAQVRDYLAGLDEDELLSTIHNGHPEALRIAAREALAELRKARQTRTLLAWADAGKPTSGPVFEAACEAQDGAA